MKMDVKIIVELVQSNAEELVYRSTYYVDCKQRKMLNELQDLTTNPQLVTWR